MYVFASSPDSHHLSQINTTTSYKSLFFFLKKKDGWYNSCAWSHFLKIKLGHFTLCNVSNINRHRVDISKNDPNKSLFCLKHFHVIVFLCATIKTYQYLYWTVCFFPASFRHSPFSEIGYCFLSLNDWVSPKSTSKLSVPRETKSSLNDLCHVSYVLQTPQCIDACEAMRSA